MQLTRVTLLTGCLVAAFTSTAASAHGIWFAPRVGQLALVYGHGAEDLPVIETLGKVTVIGGADGAGKPVAVSLRTTDHLAFVNTGNKPSIVTATLDNGLWTEGPDGKWVNKGKDEVPGANQSGRYIKYGSHLLELPKGEGQVVPSLAFQIVPVGTRFPQKKGGALKLRVLFEGKPAAGAKVWADYVNDPDAKPLVTGRDGRVTLGVRNQGLNVIKAEIESPPADASKADMTGHTTTLSFVLAHAPE
jgi:nickel transport protein